jgi:hypothetical protein
LEDIGFVGDPFTWHRGMIRERLDRGLANTEWIQLHEQAAVLHLEYNHSDHHPLLLDTNYYAMPPASGITRQIRSEAKWFKEERFQEIVEKQ